MPRFGSFRLEKTLRTYSCLTVGDVLCIAFSNKKYYLDVLELRPQQAVSIIETDCEVDFAPPLDYVEPQPTATAAATAAETSSAAADGGTESTSAEAPQFFTGEGKTLSGRKPKRARPRTASSSATGATPSAVPSASAADTATSPQPNDEVDPHVQQARRQPRFSGTGMTGRTLTGETAPHTVQPRDPSTSHVRPMSSAGRPHRRFSAKTAHAAFAGAGNKLK